MIYTQEQLEAMSDFELNDAALMLYDFNDNQCIDRRDNKVFLLTFDDVDIGKEIDRVEIDYCNNWSDIGQLIDECGVSIIKDHGYDCATNNPQEQYEPVGDSHVCVRINSKCKTLRAAAIVYILIKQGE